jgi:pimeloyl-ACP methyl ester carboxylesterase
MPRVAAVPRSDSVVTLHDGRSLAYAEWGDPLGRPVFLFHGQPGSRLLCPDADATESAGVRLITVDRPGYGRSDPQPERALLSWADDYAELHVRIGLPPCPIVGWSGGGPYALACGIRTPALVTSIGLASSTGPLDMVPGAWEGLSAEEQTLTELLRRDRAAARKQITEDCQWYADDPASVFEGWDGPDGALLAQPDVSEAMVAMMVEGARQGSVGYVADRMIKREPFGFSVADVTQDVSVWVGEADDPEFHAVAAYYAASIPRATLVTYQDAGHLVPLPRWAEMLAWLH